ncbi:unnamed protein product [Durusdinium trenchii]|uniref:Flavin-containing monooxygenase n=1 Tax=Durusdinium trenchii TaxID=1381693 RepID=A0ABP0KDG3_9DINO
MKEPFHRCFPKERFTKQRTPTARPHWPTPRKIANVIPFQYIFLSRLGQALVTGHRGALPGAPKHMSYWHQLGWPLMAGAFTVVEMLFALQFRNMSGSTSPLFKCDVVSDFYGAAQVLDYSFRDLVSAGKVDWKIGNPEAYSKHGLLVNGQELPADLIVYGTGFEKDYSVLSEDVRSKLGIEADGLYLYRHTLPPPGASLGLRGERGGHHLQHLQLRLAISLAWQGLVQPG